MAKVKKVEYYSKLVIQSQNLESFETNVKEFEIEVYQGSADSPNSTLERKLTITAEKKSDFVYKAQNDAVIDNLKIGSYYWFRIRTVRFDGNSSLWSQWYSERVGDITNEIVFSSPTVVSDSTAVTFRVSVNDIPADFEKFVWKVQTAVANLTDNPTTDKPAQPSNPNVDAVPDFETVSTDDISISFAESRTKWYHVWVRALDKSGNRAPIDSNNWYYVGCGKIKNLDLQSDSDNEPPKGTSKGVVANSEINFL